MLQDFRAEREGPLKLGGANLHPRERIVVANPNLPEAERLDAHLGIVDLAQSLRGHGGAVRDTRGEAGRCGLVPDLHAEKLGHPTHVGLVHTSLDQGRAHLTLRRGLEPRAVVAEVVAVGTVDDHREAPGVGLTARDAIQLRLAEVAAVGGIGGVARVVNLVGVHRDVWHAERAGESRGLVTFGERQGGGQGRHAEGPGAQNVMGHTQHEGAVDAAREAHQHRGHRLEEAAERRELRIHGRGRDRSTGTRAIHGCCLRGVRQRKGPW